MMMDTLFRLNAIEDIRQLKARYFRLLDTKDYAAMGHVFCTDAVFDMSEHVPPGPVSTGRTAIMAWIEEAMSPFTSTHHGHTHEVTIDSETEAHGIIAMEDEIRTADARRTIVRGTGHYTERYRLEDGDWRISSTKLTRLFRDTFRV